MAWSKGQGAESRELSKSEGEEAEGGKVRGSEEQKVRGS